MEGLLKLASAIEKKDDAQVKKLTADIAAKNDLDVLMPMFRLRNKMGIGVGTKPGAVEPDGIQLKLTELSKKALGKDQLAKEAAALEHAAYVTMAIAKVTLARAPKKDEPKRKVKDFVAFTTEMEKAAMELADAVKKGNPEGVFKAAGKNDRTKDESSCNKCHEVFMD